MRYVQVPYAFLRRNWRTDEVQGGKRHDAQVNVLLVYSVAVQARVSCFDCLTIFDIDNDLECVYAQSSQMEHGSNDQLEHAAAGLAEVASVCSNLRFQNSPADD